MELGSQIHFRLLGIDEGEGDDDPIARSLEFQVTIKEIKESLGPCYMLDRGSSESQEP